MMSGKPLQDVTDILALRWVYSRYAADPFMAPMLFLHDCKATFLDIADIPAFNHYLFALCMIMDIHA
jgi:hypothetical protein